MNLIELKDIRVTPDIVQDYKLYSHAEKVPLVIDNGSYQCRVGWSTCENPLLVFRNLIAKPRKDRKKDTAEVLINSSIQIGNDIVNIEAMRFQLKTQFDRNVVTHYHNQEKIFDYIFFQLGMSGEESIPHPIILTEPIGNPNYCRQLMSELLFECYDVPSLCYCIDSLSSSRQNKIGRDGLIISFGYHTTHVIPVLDDKLIASKVRRINVGGYHIITYLFRLMQMKYPVHLNAITISRIESLLQKHCSVAVDYISDLKKWSQANFYEKNVMKIQLPYVIPTQNNILTSEQKLEKRKELAKRLIAIKARQRKEKLVEDEEQMKIMTNIKHLYDIEDFERFQMALRDKDIEHLDELENLMESVRYRIETTKQKILMQSATEPVISDEKSHAIPQPPDCITLQNWVADVKYKRIQILERKHTRKLRRRDLATRRTAAAQERMRIISLLARKEKGSDNFGIRDEDWDVYKVISRDNDSDSEVENEKLIEYEDILRHHDPMFEDPITITGGIAEYYQLHVGVERIRAPEILFQPSMIGSPEAGLAELINYVLKMFLSEEQMRLSANVFITGGCAKLQGLKQRLSKELLEMRPYNSPHNISIAESPDLDAWLGARDFAKSSNLKDYLTTRADFAEKGGEYLKEHPTSNYYFLTPNPLITDTGDKIE